MKRLKYLAAVIAAFVCLNFVFAVNPNDKVGVLADLLIEKLGNDIALTDSQKILVKQKLNVLIVKTQNADVLSDDQEKFSLKNQAATEYQTSLDSILTTEQNMQLKLKIKDRENAK